MTKAFKAGGRVGTAILSRTFAPNNSEKINAEKERGRDKKVTDSLAKEKSEEENT